MTLRLYNTATREVEPFVPRVPGQVSIYVCGATVQAPPHVGHLRTGVAFDILGRWLRRGGLDVTLVRNVTDIGDTIFARANEAAVPWWRWAQIHERLFAEAHDAVGVERPAYEPRATGHIPDMHALISRLVDAGHAYASEGSVYFDVRSYPAYGELTNQGLDELAPAEDSPDEVKRDPRDFVLWKAAKPGEPESAVWDSPWGPGRPGWHIECSAMARRYLGPEFDIHGGGLDLRFPHHENEQAQSHAAGDGFARVWMHSAWVTQQGAKMSKSLGNSLLVSTVLESRAPAVLRLALAGVHYRSMLEYGDATLDDAAATWDRLAGFVERAGERVGQPSLEDVSHAPVPPEFADAMDDDLAVPRALAFIHESVTRGNAALASGDAAAAADALLAVRAMLDVLGLDPASPRWASGGGGASEALDALVRAELDARDAARAAKDWAAADAIRDRLAKAGVEIEDTADGARWTLTSGA